MAKTPSIDGGAPRSTRKTAPAAEAASPSAAAPTKASTAEVDGYAAGNGTAAQHQVVTKAVLDMTHELDPSKPCSLEDAQAAATELMKHEHIQQVAARVTAAGTPSLDEGKWSKTTNDLVTNRKMLEALTNFLGVATTDGDALARVFKLGFDASKRTGNFGKLGEALWRFFSKGAMKGAKEGLGGVAKSVGMKGATGALAGLSIASSWKRLCRTMDDKRSSRLEKAARFIDFGTGVLCWTPHLRLISATVSMGIAAADVIVWNDEAKAAKRGATSPGPTQA